jgi:hypothetical protein
MTGEMGQHTREEEEPKRDRSSDTLENEGQGATTHFLGGVLR